MSQEGQDTHADGEEDLRETVHQDFDSFRAAVDRAIARDPYGTLFGRRLESPATSNNSSWTSFSWMSAPQSGSMQSAQSSSTEPIVPPTGPASRPPSERSNTRNTSDKSTSTVFEEEGYEYDPISMRKVPLKKQSPEPEPEPAKPFLQSLFSEHGVNIPVKTYKPHKVYGYGGPQTKSEDSKPPTASDTTGSAVGTSRRQEFQDLLTRSKGNNIDTTAQFTEIDPQHTAEQIDDEVSTSKKVRDSPEPDDGVPLFSGTTYEGRVRKEDRKGPIDWLAKEGFRESSETSQNYQLSPDPSKLDIPVKEFRKALEPALNRIQTSSCEESQSENPRLQTALDRSSRLPKRVPEGGSFSRGPLATAQQDVAAVEELATEGLKSTQSQSDSLQKDSRAKLEADFEARQKVNEDIGDYLPKSLKVETPTSKLAKTLNNVWEHIREYPDGIVAKTMKSVTAFNSNYKKYVRPDKIQGLTDKLIFKDESLSKTASIYKNDAKPRRFEPNIPSKEVLDVVNEQQQRTANLREAAEMAKKEVEVQNTQLSRLATELQALYESEYGPIDAHHRQAASSSPEGNAAAPITSPSGSSQLSSSKPHPLSFASVKPGVATNPAVDRHISQFEPKFAELVDSTRAIRARLHDMSLELKELRESRVQVQSSVSRLDTVIQGTKEVRRQLHEAQAMMRAIESRRPEIAWNAPHMSGLDFGKKRIDLKAQQKEEPQVASDKPSHNDAANTKVENLLSSESRIEKEDTKAQVLRVLSGSASSNHETASLVESRKGKIFDSQYLILSYDASANSVSFSPMNQPTTEMPKSTNPIGILGRIKHASEYLKHFQSLQRAGYSLFNGNDNMLIFKKSKPQQTTDTSFLRTAEASQPVTHTITAGAGAPLGNDNVGDNSTKYAANVLDEIPTGVNPVPGPSAPIAPPSRPIGNFGGQSRVRRQEDVFSGTFKPGASASSSSSAGSEDEPSIPRGDTGESLWARLARGMRKTMLTIAAFGGAAYGIGFVAEGMGAHSQQQKGVEDSEAQGPRKRIVMTGQRPGIFSTESSR